jgi:hypothetical protein
MTNAPSPAVSIRAGAFSFDHAFRARFGREPESAMKMYQLMTR